MDREEAYEKNEIHLVGYIVALIGIIVMAIVGTFIGWLAVDIIRTLF